VAPVRVELEGKKFAMLVVSSKDNEKTLTIDLPVEPRSVTNVVFAPDHSLLANIKKD
jgi:hypothetical protein